MMRRICWVCLGICFFMMTSLCAEEQLDSAQKELESVSNRLEKAQKKLTQKKSLKKQTEKSLGHLNRELRRATLESKRTRRDLLKARKKVSTVEKRLKKLDSDVSVQRQLLKQRLRQLYLHQDLGFIEFLFSSIDLVSAFDSRYYFECIIRTDMELLDKLNGLERQLIRQRKLYYREKARMTSLNRKMLDQEAFISSQQRQKKQALSQLRVDISRIEKEARELEESSLKLAQFIVKQTQDAGKLFTLGKFIKPAKGWISSRFGWRKHPISKRRRMHNGLDIAAPSGYKIRAAESGIVLVASAKSQYRGYGKVTVISHGRRNNTKLQVSTVYAHQSRILVKEGQYVEKGDVIGMVGSTGYSTGPHLHFEVRENGRPVNPQRYLRL